MYHDVFGNRGQRLAAPVGELTIRTDRQPANGHMLAQGNGRSACFMTPASCSRTRGSLASSDAFWIDLKSDLEGDFHIALGARCGGASCRTAVPSLNAERLDR
jgi:hypothetical protein